MSPNEKEKNGNKKRSDKKPPVSPSSSTASDVLEDKLGLAYRVRNNPTSSSRAGASGDSGLSQPSVPRRRVSKGSTDKKAYQEQGEGVQRETGLPMTAAVPRHSKSGSEKTEHGITTDNATRPGVTDSIPHATSDEQSAMTLDVSMPSLRRTQPAEFTPRDTMDSLELRQPAQRLVKIQPEQGQRRPGAYAHQSTRRFSDRDAEQPSNNDMLEPMETMDETMLDEGTSGLVSQNNVSEPLFAARTTTGGVAGASVNDEESLVPAEVEVYTDDAPETIPLDSANGNKKPSRRRLYILIGLAVLVVVAVGAGVGVALSGSKSNAVSLAPVAAPAPTTEECTMTEIEEECSISATGSFTAMPECLSKLREDLMSRLPSNLVVDVSSEKDTSCSAENLSLLSVALHASAENSTAVLSDRLGLSLLFYATNGRKWVKGRDWVSSKPHCDWDGVGCFQPESDIFSGTYTSRLVEYLDMSHFNMQGPLPSRLMILLPELTDFDISLNALTGTLAPEFHELYTLSAGANGFTGTLPAAFFASTTLETLALASNNDLRFTAVPFVGAQWEVLALSGSIIEGNLISSITVLSNLETLSLSEGILAGTLPTEMGRMTKLTVLSLDRNPLLAGVIPTELQNLVNLRTLMMSGCPLSGTMPSELGKLTELQALDLSSTKLSGGMPTELGLLTKLTSLLFQDNDFVGTIPSEVCALKIDGDLQYLGARSLSLVCDSYGGLVCPTDIPGCCN